MCATLTYTALSTRHRYLISILANALMTDFSYSARGNLSHQAQKQVNVLIISKEKCLSDSQEYCFIAAIEF